MSSICSSGSHIVYLHAQKKIGIRGGIRNILDAYLIDLTSRKEPRLYVVENELARHEPLKHVAVQILEFSLSFETTPQRVKAIVKASLADNPEGWAKRETDVQENGFENVDYLLEKIIYYHLIPSLKQKCEQLPGRKSLTPFTLFATLALKFNNIEVAQGVLCPGWQDLMAKLVAGRWQRLCSSGRESSTVPATVRWSTVIWSVVVS